MAFLKPTDHFPFDLSGVCPHVWIYFPKESVEETAKERKH